MWCLVRLFPRCEQLYCRWLRAIIVLAVIASRVNSESDLGNKCFCLLNSDVALSKVIIVRLIIEVNYQWVVKNNILRTGLLVILNSIETFDTLHVGYDDLRCAGTFSSSSS